MTDEYYFTSTPGFNSDWVEKFFKDQEEKKWTHLFLPQPVYEHTSTLQLAKDIYPEVLVTTHRMQGKSWNESMSSANRCSEIPLHRFVEEGMHRSTKETIHKLLYTDYGRTESYLAVNAWKYYMETQNMVFIDEAHFFSNEMYDLYNQWSWLHNGYELPKPKIPERPLFMAESCQTKQDLNTKILRYVTITEIREVFERDDPRIKETILYGNKVIRYTRSCNITKPYSAPLVRCKPFAPPTYRQALNAPVVVAHGPANGQKEYGKPHNTHKGFAGRF